MTRSSQMREGLKPPASPKLLQVNKVSIEQNDAANYSPIGNEQLAEDIISGISFNDRHWPCGDQVQQEDGLPISTLFMIAILILLQSRAAWLLLFIKYTAAQFWLALRSRVSRLKLTSNQADATSQPDATVNPLATSIRLDKCLQQQAPPGILQVENISIESIDTA